MTIIFFDNISTCGIVQAEYFTYNKQLNSILFDFLGLPLTIDKIIKGFQWLCKTFTYSQAQLKQHALTSRPLMRENQENEEMPDDITPRIIF